TLPDGYIVDGGREWFERWFRDAVAQSDGLVSISYSAALEVQTYLSSMKESLRQPRIGFWHLGADFCATSDADSSVSRGSHLVPNPYLLMVGTIERRKAHGLALSAMEQLWKEGFDLSLCIAGKEGWMVSELMTRLRHHPLAGSKLFLLERPSDADIDRLYSNAS